MDQKAFIASLEAKAERHGVSRAQICERAGVHPTLFGKWKREKNPVAAGYDRLIGLQNALDELIATPPEAEAA